MSERHADKGDTRMSSCSSTLTAPLKPADREELLTGIVSGVSSNTSTAAVKYVDWSCQTCGFSRATIRARPLAECTPTYLTRSCVSSDISCKSSNSKITPYLANRLSWQEVTIKRRLPVMRMSSYNCRYLGSEIISSCRLPGKYTARTGITGIDTVRRVSCTKVPQSACVSGMLIHSIPSVASSAFPSPADATASLLQRCRRD
mmetsp:Transcript_90736/g.292894  ORF Transcript_90736/g.292894 Transcript_90736/m.292894 type:complete len:203 (+) Transcript_90736:631-1239(+)